MNIEIGTPVAFPGSDWGCRLRIVGLPKRFDRGIFGVDAIQALELALTLSGRLLESLIGSSAGQIELWDEPVKDVFGLFLPLPLHSLQGALENLRGYLQRSKMKGRANVEWRRGTLVVMKELKVDLAKLVSRERRWGALRGAG